LRNFTEAIMKAILAASAGALVLGLATPASAGRDEAQWQQHWKSVAELQKMKAQGQPTGAAVAGRHGSAGREGRPACPGIGSAHPKRAYNC
jgi:outer membrane biogenesis lipoprotein LolB